MYRLRQQCSRRGNSSGYCSWRVFMCRLCKITSSPFAGTASKYLFPATCVELTSIVLRIPQSRRESKDKGWTIDDIERLTRLGNLRVQQFPPKFNVPADSR